MEHVLVLNATFEPLSIVTVRRAMILLLKEKAEVIEAAEAQIRSQYLAFHLPLVIRLVYYVRVPHRLLLPLTRRTVLARDRYTCQYCGAQPAKSQLTLDHVVPRCRGGKTDWDNVVSACVPCNQRKGKRIPQEAGMRLIAAPERPRYLAFVLLSKARGPQAWEKYLYSEIVEQNSRI